MSGGDGAPRRAFRGRLAAALALPVALALGCRTVAAADPPATALVTFAVIGDAILDPLTTAPADAARGRNLIVAREAANCVLCHAVPDAAVRFSGDVGPSLAGVGARFTVPQLRLRVADNMRVHPATIMPSYYRIDGLSNVAAVYRGKPILSARDVEDVVAYLAALR
jgi:sulfur-oxidizing protein SoxX